MRGITPDMVTDQTCAHDPLMYLPNGMGSMAAAVSCAAAIPREYQKRSMQAMADHCRAMVEMQKRGAVVLDYGNNLRQQAFNAGYTGVRWPAGGSWVYPGFVPAYIRPLFCEGQGPFRWVALSGDPQDIYETDQIIMDSFPKSTTWCAGSRWPRSKSASRACPAGSAGWATASGTGPAWPSTTRSPAGGSSAPIVIGRDHLDCGSVASPNRETEGMRDGSDAIADWPLLNFAMNTIGGATWVSFHHGGGVGIGYSLHAGQVIVADGTARRRAPPEAGPDLRSGHGHRAACRRRLPGGHRLCPAHGVHIPMLPKS